MVGRIPVGLRLKSHVNARLEQVAKELGISKSAFAEAAIKEKLKRYRKAKD